MSVAQMPAPVPFWCDKCQQPEHWATTYSQLSVAHGSLTKVEYPFGIGSYWRQVQLIVERQEAYVVYNGLVIVLLGIVRLPVLPISIGMVPSPILISIHVCRGGHCASAGCPVREAAHRK